MSDEKKKSVPGRIVMVEGVPDYRGCMSLRKGSVQRLDKEATKELVNSGKAEVYEDREERLEVEEAKKKAVEKKAATKPPKPTAEKPPKPVALKPAAEKKD